MLNSINVNYQNYQTLPQNKNLVQNSNSAGVNSTQDTGTNLGGANSTPNSQSTNSTNLVLDKSEAVSKVLGYGVDSEGYFTSDFNETVGLPKDYKIYAKNLESLNESLTTTRLFSQKLYHFIDWAKELGDFYKNNLQDFDTKFGQGFNEEDFKNIVGEEVDFNAVKNNFAFNAEQNGIAKGSLLLSAFVLKGDYLKLSGETTLYAKIQGFDASISESDMNEFDNFVQKHQLQDPNNIAKSRFKGIIPDTWVSIDKERSKLQNFVAYAKEFELGNDILDKAKALKDEFDELMSMDLSLDESKEKYLDFKQRHEEFVKEYEEAMGDKMMPQIINAKEQGEEKKTFTPIEAESSRETYKDLSGAKNLELAKIEQKADMLAILLNQKAGESSAFNELQKFINSGGGIDLKA